MSTEKEKIDAARHRDHLLDQVKKRGWTRTKREVFTLGLVPVAFIVSIGILTISYFTYRLLSQNNTIAYVSPW
jgi:hypothetical protein